MCRLLAYRSDKPRSAFRHLVSAPHALAHQSVAHPDGWGVAHLDQGAMQVTRAVEMAKGSEVFARHARGVTSNLVVAHIRKASVGGNTLENTHPFEHDGWVFAHNGTVRKFADRRGAFEKRIDRALLKALTGDTDSERCFFLFLTELAKEKRGAPLDRAANALGRVARYTRESDPPNTPRPSVANFVATNGDLLLCLRFGRQLHVLGEGGAPTLRDGTPLRAMVVSSEPTEPDQPWRKLEHGDLVAIDHTMKLRRLRYA